MTEQLRTKSTKAKRRETAKKKRTSRPPAQDDTLYEIRDIIDEKYEKGKLVYKVDWADHPTTGERYEPSWEPAENVTEAAIADWEREKRRRQGAELEGTHFSVSTDSQPVLSPNWRAKRRRGLSVDSEHERSPKRLRRSIDSGYTSTPDDEGNWALVQSVPAQKGEIVLEISAPPGFDPSEYQTISLSQSAPSSQVIPSDNAASRGEDSERAIGQVRQRTVPDSQDGFDSLHTQSTSQPPAHLSGVGISEQTRQPVPAGSSQEADKEQPDLSLAAESSRSNLDIPSRQPEQSHQGSGRSSGLLDTPEVAQGTLSDSIIRHLDSEPELPPEEHLGASEDSPWSGGFLTQPDFELPISLDGSGSSRSIPLNQADWQSTSAPRNCSFPSAAESHPQYQAAQAVPLFDSNPSQIRTQSSEHPAERGDEEVVPDTVQRESRRTPPSQNSNQLVSKPRHREGEEFASNQTGSVGSSGNCSRPSTSATDNSIPLPFTPQNQRMDRPSAEGTPRSAVEIMRQLQASVFGSSPELVGAHETRPQPDPVSPSAVLPRMDSIPQHPPGAPTAHAQDSFSLEASSKDHPLSVEELNPCIGVGINVPSEHTVMVERSTGYQQPPGTVAPSDLTASVDHISGTNNALSAAGQQIRGGVEDAIPTTVNIEPDQLPADINPEEQEDDSNGRYFVVTLPMAANTRSVYLDTITENKALMIEFGRLFAESELRSSVPDPALVANMDRLFERLLNLCDLPAYDESLLGLGKEGMMKHATNSNSKYSFVYEFLNGLWDLNVRVLILCQPGRVFEYLEAILSVAGFPYTVLGEENSAPHPTGGMSVILAVAGQDLSKIEGGVDAVLVFDHAARPVELPATVYYDSTIVLSLVVTYSLEHIDQQLLQLMPELGGLERKNALNLATITIKEQLRSPERGYPEPHQAAEMFANLLRIPDAGLAWDPQALPAETFDLWLSSQEGPQEPQSEIHHGDFSSGSSGRKRPSDDAEEGMPKRSRLLDAQPVRNTTPARMSDLLKRTLASYPVSGKASTQVIEIPVEQLERMAEKIAELDDRLATQNGIEAKLQEHMTSLESQLRSYERTVQSIQPKYMVALRDRGTFEKECKAALEKASAATEKLEAHKAEVETMKEKNKVLESKLAEATAALANSTIPEVARLAQAEKEREEALATVEKLEKKVRIVQNDLDYSRKAYQDASNAHGELIQENRELKARIADLEKRASENLLKIHQVHAQNEAAAATRQIDELRATLENRERELERAKEEIRLLRNGRRETRQASVPRSPRPGAGVMSPRPGRGGVGGAGSRGTSPAPVLGSDGLGGGTPVPGMAFFQPGGNGGRWGHLRD
ncbi:hypothetical protein VTK56DRAFT_7410 [Thermocarpiscus australiensis]